MRLRVPERRLIDQAAFFYSCARSGLRRFRKCIVDYSLCGVKPNMANVHIGSKTASAGLLLSGVTTSVQTRGGFEPLPPVEPKRTE